MGTLGCALPPSLIPSWDLSLVKPCQKQRSNGWSIQVEKDCRMDVKQKWKCPRSSVPGFVLSTGPEIRHSPSSKSCQWWDSGARKTNSGTGTETEAWVNCMGFLMTLAIKHGKGDEGRGERGVWLLFWIWIPLVACSHIYIWWVDIRISEYINDDNNTASYAYWD